MSKALHVWPTTLPDGMTGAELEKFWVEEFLPNVSEFPGMRNTLCKGYRGERTGQYLFLAYFESADRQRNPWLNPRYTPAYYSWRTLSDPPHHG